MEPDIIETSGINIEFLPRWIELALIGPLIVYFIVAASIVLTKAGRNSAWSLILLIPFVQPIAIWWFAFCKWPRQEDDEA